MNSPTFRFIPAMYRAVVVDKIKTQTRRVIVPQPGSDINPVLLDECSGMDYCFQWHSKESRRVPPYGPPGTVKPVVTTWAIDREWNDMRPAIMDPDVILAEHGIWFNDGSPKPDWAGKARPAMFFPKQLYPFARQAKVVSVKAERVQSISEEDAKAEGFKLTTANLAAATSVLDAPAPFAVRWFCNLWDSINATRADGAYAWNRNPWVFAITFEVLPL